MKRSAVMELVQRENEKMSERLEAVKSKRTPRTLTPLCPRSVSRTPKTDLYKRTLFLREANRISQHLKKDTVRVLFL